MTAAPEPAFWDAVVEQFRLYAASVERIFYQGTNDYGQHIVGVVVYNKDDGTSFEVGWNIGALNIDLDGQRVRLELGEECISDSQRVLPAECSTCQVSWGFCRQAPNHLSDARQSS